MTLELFALDPVVVDADFTLYRGGALEVLRELDDASVDCVVTSPPYWRLRNYDGGELELGREPTPELYVERLVELFAELERVLAEHGVVWLNLGDTYATSGGYKNGRNGLAGAAAAVDGVERRRSGPREHRSPRQLTRERNTVAPGHKEKDLVGIPWLVAFALRAAGWHLRADVIWSKPNPMPESVDDRPTKAHEYVFLLTKRRRYYYDAAAIDEPAVYGRDLGILRTRRRANENELAGIERRRAAGVDSRTAGDGRRNARSVWTIPTTPFAEAHFAVFPLELARRCIAAGCPELVCRTCGRPRERIVERIPFYDHETTAAPAAELELVRNDLADGNGHDVRHGVLVEVRELGWTDCGHDDYRRGVVLDPFLGSGTTALAARRLGRHAVGVELNPAYCRLAAHRLAQLSLFAEVPA